MAGDDRLGRRTRILDLQASIQKGGMRATAVPRLLSYFGVKESVAGILHLLGGAQELDRRWSFFLKEK